MGSSKSAQALITKFNYEERGMKVWLIKPATDTRDGLTILHSRIGLEAQAQVIKPEDDIYSMFVKEHADCNVIISDEAQFFTPEQVDQMRNIVDDLNIPVLNFGLKTDFRTRVFPGSLRLLEVSEEITEIKTICSCGRKATVNARVINGQIVTEGEQVLLGGNDSYVAMCHRCWKQQIEKQKH